MTHKKISIKYSFNSVDLHFDMYATVDVSRRFGDSSSNQAEVVLEGPSRWCWRALVLGLLKLNVDAVCCFKRTSVSVSSNFMIIQ